MIAEPVVSIIIVSFNVKDLLRECLKSLRHESIPFEVFVVDNASQDGTLTMLKTEFGDWSALIIIANDENFGFAKANNQAIPRCLGKYILFLNPDTIVKPGAITALANYLDTHPDVGVVGPRVTYEDGSLQLSCGTRPTLLGTIFDSFQLYKLSPRIFGRNRYGEWDHHSQQRDVGWVSGACLMIRKDLAVLLGGFDENFFFTAEDVDLCYRVLQKGYRVVYYPNAEIIHLEAQSSHKVRPMILLKAYQSKLYFYRKHRGKSSAIVLRGIFSLSSLAKAAFAGVACLIKPKEYCSIFRAHFGAMFKVWTLPIPKPPAGSS